MDIMHWRVGHVTALAGITSFTPPPTPHCKGERKRVFTLSVTETIQHAPQGRRNWCHKPKQMSFLKIFLSAPHTKKSGGATGLAKLQGPGLLRAGAWGPGPQGLGARAPGAWGPGFQDFGVQDQFFVILKSLLAGGWRRGGSQLKRLPQMWGPGGKRARDTPPTLPPPPPPPRF